MDTCIIVRGAWTGLCAALGIYLFIDAQYAHPALRFWIMAACVAVWLFLFLPSLAILLSAGVSIETTARSMLVYDIAVLALLFLATFLLDDRAAALRFGGVLAVVGGPLALEVAQARQEIAYDRNAWQRAAGYWVAGLAVIWLTALSRTQG